ncbi:MAG: sensor histidine kinase [Bacteroidetes bacterium]|nr:sensor histidine kinase [Bacteroidota bacterium]
MSLKETTYDFLNQGIKQTRKSIRDIDDSYNNDWDILAELCQNSVDAIRKSDIKSGLIKIIIDSQNKSISVIDNGIGIVPDRLPELLAPFSTDKEDDEDSVGEKGVGLTFVIFSCNDFYIKSGNKSGVSEGRIFDANIWKSSTDDRKLDLTHRILNEKFQGTEILMKKVIDSPLFELSMNQLKFLLRTRTSIGNTNSIWEDDKKIEVEITHVNQDGQRTVEALPFKYWLITESLSSNAKIDIEEYYKYIEKDRTDQDKRVKLQGKVIYKISKINHNGRTIKYFACFVPKRKTWNDLTVSFNIATAEQLENSDWLDKRSYVTLQPGIFTSVKGMPTGISIDNPITGASGAWPQIFILFDDRQLKFDIGRKSIHGMQARIYKQYARQIFSEFQKLAKYFSGEVLIESDWEKDNIFAEIDKMLNLDISGINWKKVPKDQEASVAGLFFECIGNKKLSGIDLLVAGYRNKYDLYAKWGNRKVVIEFKAHLSSILKDFTDAMKLFNEINCVVCWNVTEEDEQALKQSGIDIEEVDAESLLPGSTTTIFPNATHKLSISGFVSPVYVIDMKKIIGAS